jgi:hypothetical protein
MFLESILVIVVITLLYFFFLMWRDRAKLKKLQKNYNPNDDKSKQGEERRKLKYRGPEIRRFEKSTDTESGSSGQVELEREKLLPPTSTKFDGETSSSSRKPSPKLKGIFRKLRRK